MWRVVFQGNRFGDFLDKGANPYTLDEFNRTALHCLAIHGAAKADVSRENVELFLSVYPRATALVDELGLYPLYYALIFSPKDLWEPILRATPTDVIEKVRGKIVAKGVPSTEELMRLWKTRYRISSPIYSPPTSLEERPAQNLYLTPRRSDLLSSLDEAIKKKEMPVISLAGQIYYAHHDGEGWAHCLFTKKAKELFAEDPDSFIEEASEGRALFLPSVVRTPLEYEKLVSESVRLWVNSGANLKIPYIRFDRLIGTAGGKKTYCVKIEGALDSRGAHIVPVHLTS